MLKNIGKSSTEFLRSKIIQVMINPGVKVKVTAYRDVIPILLGWNLFFFDIPGLRDFLKLWSDTFRY